jgi:drug/metabolite transporter (DMT)-like permease
LSILGLIAGRVLASPIVNVFQKKLTHQGISPELVVMISYLFFVLLSIPFFIFLQPFDLPAEFWLYISLLGVFDVFGNMFLVKSLKTTDLSVFGPLNSYKPVVALCFSALILREVPSFAGVLGVLVIILGSYFLSIQSGAEKINIRKFLTQKGIIFRFSAILLTSIAAVFSKKTILLSSPLITLLYWSVIGWPISAILVRMLNPSWKKEVNHISKQWRQVVLLCLSFLALQVFTLLTFEQVFVGYSLALFQLSSVISVFYGFHFFNERNFKYRLVGSVIMVMGTILIFLYG